MKDFYIPPLLKTLAGRGIQETTIADKSWAWSSLESASTKKLLDKTREMVYHFRRAFWCCWGGVGVGREDGGWWWGRGGGGGWGGGVGGG